MPVLLALIVGPAAAVAACDDLPAASLDAADAGDLRETGTNDDATSLPDGDPRLDAGADVDADSEAGRCPFTTPDAAALPVTTCTAKFGNGVDRLLAGAVTVDAQGNIVFAGVLYGTVDFGGGPLASAGGQDIFIVKLNASCQHVWSKRFGGADQEGGKFVATNRAGDVYLASDFIGTVDFGTGPLTNSALDFALTKFDACGNVLWAKKFGKTGVARLGGMNLDSQSNILLGGGFYGSIDFGSGVKTGNQADALDIFLAKLDGDGKHVWSKVVTRPGDDTGTGVAGTIAFAPDGTIYAAGSGNGNPGGGGRSTSAPAP